MICNLCNKPVVLSPSAKERAAKDVGGKSAADYERMFPRHAECELRARKAFKYVRETNPLLIQAELLRLRQRAASLLFGADAGSRDSAEHVNAMGFDELEKVLQLT